MQVFRMKCRLGVYHVATFWPGSVEASSGITAVSFCFLCLTCTCFLLLLQSKPESSELVSPKTTDDIVQEKGEEGQRAARRRHKTENVKQQWSQDKAMTVELEQAQRCVRTEAAWSSALTCFGQKCNSRIRNCGYFLFCRKEISQLEEGDVGTLHPIFQLTCHQWITYMEKLGKLKLIFSYLMV